MSASTPYSITVLGAGAWGTAFALHLTRLTPAPRVTLWARDPEHAQAIDQQRLNTRYLPNEPLPDALHITTGSLDTALAGTDLLIAATPMAALPDLFNAFRNSFSATSAIAPPLFWLSKGLLTDSERVLLPHQRLAPLWPAPIGALSGPSFAQEVARGLPTALVIAATDPQCAHTTAAHLRSDTLRIYPNDDLTGVEIGGAVKNVLAIAAGISDGLQLGHNTRATLITRGLAEMARLTEALGGQRTTLMGLAGLGDLILTCTGNLSRNRRVGLMLAEGLALPDILQRLGHVAEGVPAARAATVLAQQANIELPIASAVARILDGQLTAHDAVELLLKRVPADESGGHV